jgi:hypothetical protein
MSSQPPYDVAQRSRPRFGIIGLLFVLTFLAGLAVAAVAARRFGWFVAERPAAEAASTQTSGLAPIPVAPPPVVPTQLDLATLTSREAQLAGRLAALEARAAAVTVDAENAGAQAGRAEAVLVAGAARRALDRGLPLGRLEEQLRLRFGATQPRAVDLLVDSAREPVTLEALRARFDAVAPDLRSGGQRDWWRSLRRELGSLVVLRRAGDLPDRPVERLARVRRLLDAGQVEAAVVEAQSLPGAALAGDWTLAARRYVLARQALDALETDAITRPAPVGPLSAPAPVPTPVG